MKDLPIIYLLLNTKVGKIIIGIFVVYIVVSIAGWWLVPIIASLIGCVMIYDYYEALRNDEKLQERNTGGLSPLCHRMELEKTIKEK